MGETNHDVLKLFETGHEGPLGYVEKTVMDQLIHCDNFGDQRKLDQSLEVTPNRQSLRCPLVLNTENIAKSNRQRPQTSLIPFLLPLSSDHNPNQNSKSDWQTSSKSGST